MPEKFTPTPEQQIQKEDILLFEAEGWRSTSKSIKDTWLKDGIPLPGTKYLSIAEKTKTDGTIMYFFKDSRHGENTQVPELPTKFSDRPDIQLLTYNVAPHDSAKTGLSILHGTSEDDALQRLEPIGQETPHHDETAEIEEILETVLDENAPQASAGDMHNIQAKREISKKIIRPSETASPVDVHDETIDLPPPVPLRGIPAKDIPVTRREDEVQATQQEMSDSPPKIQMRGTAKREIPETPLTEEEQWNAAQQALTAKNARAIQESLKELQTKGTSTKNTNANKQVA